MTSNDQTRLTCRRGFRIRKCKEKYKDFPIHESEVELPSGNAKAEGGSKGIWYPEELDRDLRGGFRARIACQALGPGKTPVCSFGTGNQPNRLRLSRWNCFSEFNIDALVTKEFHDRSPMKTPGPVSPHNRMRSGGWRWGSNGFLWCAAWPEHRTDAAWFLGGRPIALTRFTHRAGTTMTDPGGIDYAHTPVSFGATLLRIERETGRTV